MTVSQINSRSQGMCSPVSGCKWLKEQQEHSAWWISNLSTSQSGTNTCFEACDLGVVFNILGGNHRTVTLFKADHPMKGNLLQLPVPNLRFPGTSEVAKGVI